MQIKSRKQAYDSRGYVDRSLPGSAILEEASDQAAVADVSVKKTFSKNESQEHIYQCGIMYLSDT